MLFFPSAHPKGSLINAYVYLAAYQFWQSADPSRHGFATNLKTQNPSDLPKTPKSEIQNPVWKSKLENQKAQIPKHGFGIGFKTLMDFGHRNGSGHFATSSKNDSHFDVRGVGIGWQFWVSRKSHPPRAHNTCSDSMHKSLCAFFVHCKGNNLSAKVASNRITHPKKQVFKNVFSKVGTAPTVPRQTCCDDWYRGGCGAGALKVGCWQMWPQGCPYSCLAQTYCPGDAASAKATGVTSSGNYKMFHQENPEPPLWSVGKHWNATVSICRIWPNLLITNAKKMSQTWFGPSVRLP